MYTDGASGWSSANTLVGSDSNTGDGFGSRVASDGTRFLVAAVYDWSLVSSGGSMYVFESAAPVTAYCFGDGSGTACPCGNNSAAGSGEGCLNSTGSGAILSFSGTTGVAADDLVLHLSQAPPFANAFMHAATGNTQSIIDDGLLCTNGPIFRFPVVPLDASGEMSVAQIASTGGWASGATLYFQAWFRDGPMSPCGQLFNLSNALAVTFCP